MAKQTKPQQDEQEQTTALVTQQPAKVPAPMYDEGDFGAGFEDFTSDDVAVPFLGILQKGSPQVEEDNPKYLKGAKPGMLFNTVSGDLFDGKETGITVIPVHRVRNFIEWIPKDEGGGLVRVFNPDAPEVVEVLAGQKAYGKLKIGDGNDLVETFSVFALLVREDGTYERVVISFASTQIATYKRWMTMAQSVTVNVGGRNVVPPMFAHKYRLKTQFTQKKEYTWYKYTIGWDAESAVTSRLGADDELYQAARAFRALVVGGRVQMNFEAGATRDDDVDHTGPENNLDM